MDQVGEPVSSESEEAEAAGGVTAKPSGRSPRSHSRLAWLAASATVVVTAANIVLLTVNYSVESKPESTGGATEYASGVAYLAIAAIGFNVLRRQDNNRAGWAFLWSGSALAFGAFASEYATYGVLTDPGVAPAVPWVAWLGVCAWWTGAASGLAFALILYPDGSLPSPRWRPWSALAIGNVVVLGMLHALAPGRLDGEYAIVVNPVGVEPARLALRALRDLGWVLVLINAAVGTAALIGRARAEKAPLRRPLTSLAVAGVSTVFATAVWGVSGGAEGRSGAVRFVVGVAVLAVPVSVGLATARTAALRRSIDRLVAAREEERLRIRRDLHDGLGPTLAGVALQLDLAKTLVDTDGAAAAGILDRLTGQVQVAISDIRRLVDDLRPPVLDQLGLVPAIEQGTSSLSRHAVGCDFKVFVAARGDLADLPPSVDVAAYRIVMEAATNACRHSQASTCEVRLALDDALRITVEDDGVGMPDAYEQGVGLSSMHQRAIEIGGSCSLERRDGGGTVVRVALPVART